MKGTTSIQRILHIFQWFGLSLIPVTSEKRPSHDYYKFYSLFHIAIRVIILIYAAITNQFFIRNSELKIVSAIDTVLICGIRLVEIILLMESLSKREKEKQFFDELLRIDNVLKTRFHIDMIDFRRDAHLSIIWLCIFAFAEISILYLARENAAYFYFCLTYLLPFITSSLSYFQIITWTKQIEYRFNALIQLLNDMNSDENEFAAHNWQPEIVKNTISCDLSGNLNENIHSINDTYLVNRLIIACDLYHRLWNETNLINERFRCSMVCNIGNDFVSILSNSYWMFMSLLKSNFSQNVSVFGCILWSCLSIFHILMLCKTCHSTAERATKIAHVIHCIKHVTHKSKLSSFVSE